MLDRRKIRYTYLKLSKKIKDFLLSDKSREFLIFLFFFLIAGGFWLLQTLNNDYEAEFSIPVRVKDLPNNVVQMCIRDRDVNVPLVEGDVVWVVGEKEDVYQLIDQKSEKVQVG